MLRAQPRLDCSRNRIEDAVREQHPEERSDEGGRHLLADFLGRPADRAHGDDDAEHGRYDAERGHRITHLLDRGRDGSGLLVLTFQIEIEDVGEMMILHRTGQKNLQRIREE